MLAFLKKYTTQGSFIFSLGNRLAEVSSSVPHSPGVYIVEINPTKEIVYIGRSGTYNQRGQFSKQLLQKRINNSHDGKSRQNYFEEKLKTERVNSIKISWYVTFDKKHTDLPAYVEALLMNEFFRKHKKLPKWNKGF